MLYRKAIFAILVFLCGLNSSDARFQIELNFELCTFLVSFFLDVSVCVCANVFENEQLKCEMYCKAVNSIGASVCIVVVIFGMHWMLVVSKIFGARWKRMWEGIVEIQTVVANPQIRWVTDALTNNCNWSAWHRLRYAIQYYNTTRCNTIRCNWQTRNQKRARGALRLRLSTEAIQFKVILTQLGCNVISRLCEQ